MTLNNLYYFNEIVKDMNLSVTAERLFTTQQALSGHIKRLENYFGVRLFERTLPRADTRGRELQREAKLMLDAEMRLFNSFGTRPARQKGTIKIACGLARSRFYLPEIISRFTSKYPNVRITFVDENNFRDRPMFSGTDVDMAIGREPKPSTGLKVHPLMEMGGCVAISDLLLREHLGDKANEFIKKAKDGVEISELPPTIPVAHTGIAKRESWVCERIPELRRPRCTLTPRTTTYCSKSAARKGDSLHFGDICEVHIEGIRPLVLREYSFFPAQSGRKEICDRRNALV